MAAEEAILSMVLSTSELANIDLSNIQLFQAKPNAVHQYGGHFSHPLVCPTLFLDAEGHEGVQIRRVDGSANINPEKPKQSSGLLGCVPPGIALGVPVVLKSKGVIDAERSMLQLHIDDNRRKKAVSMDETDFKGLEREKPKPKPMARDDSAVGKSRSINALKRRDRPPALPMFSRNRREGIAEENVASIDLKSSPAAKFLVQVMPWELQPSPITPYTPAAVPFKWEEVPGKPKPHQAGTLPALQLPRPPSRATLNPEDPDDDQNTESLESSRPDHKLPRGAGQAKASAFISTWRKSKTANYTKNAPANSVSSDRSGGHSGELLMGGELLWENPKDGENARSLNARIAAAMDVKLYDDSAHEGVPNLCSRRIIAPPIPSPSRDHNGKALEKKSKRRRKWVVRKLRRPSRFFRAFFKAVWRAVSCRKSRHRQQGSLKLSYQTLSRPDVL